MENPVGIYIFISSANSEIQYSVDYPQSSVQRDSG